MERAGEQVPASGRTISRRAVGRILYGGIVAWTGWSWYRTEINPPDNEFTRKEDALIAQRKLVAKDLRDSGAVLQRGGWFRSEVLDQNNPKTAEFYSLNKEISEVDSQAIDKEGRFWFKVRAGGVTVGPLLTIVGGLVVLADTVDPLGKEKESNKAETPLVF